MCSRLGQAFLMQCLPQCLTFLLSFLPPVVILWLYAFLIFKSLYILSIFVNIYVFCIFPVFYCWWWEYPETFDLNKYNSYCSPCFEIITLTSSLLAENLVFVQPFAVVQVLCSCYFACKYTFNGFNRLYILFLLWIPDTKCFCKLSYLFTLSTCYSTEIQQASALKFK